MRIVSINKRVGDSISKYEYLASIDFETDITKYGNETFKDRFKTQIFSIDVLEKAENYDLFISDITKLDFKWWRDNVGFSFLNIRCNAKYIYRVLKLHLKQIKSLV